ncbi:hypothetical protein [Roseomonas sp. CECT 9278]|uniref:hypothetical protein n=1 Tax=Roseomonas sp. CECT 9278 TaxID=2845823 RepID=UPI001E440D05|nr:hypothetical protein [Roseomonas sp. CECT 9278]CAH0258556.1 hypothetical protein ROS9278_03335 [Roseomonas sp. CECT 9278]
MTAQAPAGREARGTPRLRAARDAPQQVWVVFGGQADQAWLRPLRRGFRHCFAALRDEAGWTVVEPVSGRLLVLRVNMPARYDLPGFYRRAGLRVVGPFAPGEARARWLPPVLPQTCVGLCRALLGSGAPFAVTPFGLFRRLVKKFRDDRKNVLTAAAA